MCSPEHPPVIAKASSARVSSLWYSHVSTQSAKAAQGVVGVNEQFAAPARDRKGETRVGELRMVPPRRDLVRKGGQGTLSAPISNIEHPLELAKASSARVSPLCKVHVLKP